ncbi:unnamed protein product [Rhizophagus irregularis]|nr:unnamed protein product [Rhizophagus irregularis]
MENQKSLVNTEAITLNEINIGSIGNTQSFLICGHIFYRLCIEKKLFLGTLNTCPASGCEKNVDILDQADVLSIISNLPIPDSRVTFQSSGILPLSDLMETFTLSSPPIRMEGIKSTAT